MRDYFWRPTTKPPFANLLSDTRKWFQGQIEAAVTEFVEKGMIYIGHDDSLGTVMRFAAPDPLDGLIYEEPLEPALLEEVQEYCHPRADGPVLEQNRATLLAYRDLLARVLAECDRRLAPPA
jgi:hypothetical protein